MRISQPDVVALQDVLTGEAGQDSAVLGVAAPTAEHPAQADAAQPYLLFSCRSPRSQRTSSLILCVPSARSCHAHSPTPTCLT